MKKNKPPKKKVNSENAELKIEELIKQEGGILSKLYEKDVKPFKHLADTLNPFLTALKEFKEFRPLSFQTIADWPRVTAFSLLIDKICDFATKCVDPDVFHFGTKAQIEEGFKTLKSEIKEIETLLKLLISIEVKKKKEAQYLRLFRVAHEALVKIIDEIILPELRKYLAPSYKGKMKQKQKDIEKFWEEKFKGPYPKTIKMDNRTETTIALSIIAYQTFSPYGELQAIYYKAKKQIKHPA